MMQHLSNASAHRTIVAIGVLAGVMWLGDLVTGQPPAAFSYLEVAALVVVSVVVDHLHGIRGELKLLALLGLRAQATELNLIMDDPSVAQPALVTPRESGLS